jgi:radical SAM protein with 4Fe4S-binding SPASM domain
MRFLQRPHTGLSISVDGYGPTGHDIHRVFKGGRRGSWGIIEANIAKAVENGIVPYILATVSQESAKTLPALVRWIFGQGLKARLSVVRQPESTEAYSSFRINAMRKSIEEEYRELTTTMNAAFEEAFQELEQDAYVMDLRNALNICELHFDSPSFSSCCGIGLNHIVINEKGEIASCPMTIHRDTVKIKPDVLESVQLTFVQHSPTDRERNEGKNCLDCRWFPVCVSGCPINNLAVNGRPYSVSPLNAFYEYVIPRYVKFFGRKLRQSASIRGIQDFLVLTA